MFNIPWYAASVAQTAFRQPKAGPIKKFGRSSSDGKVGQRRDKDWIPHGITGNKNTNSYRK